MQISTGLLWRHRRHLLAIKSVNLYMCVQNYVLLYVIHKRELALSLLLNRWAPFTVIIRLALRLLPYTRFCIFYSHNRRIFATAEGKPSFLLQRETLNQTAVRHQPFLGNWGSRIEILGWEVGHGLLSLDIMNGHWRPLLPLKWHFRFGLRAGSVSGRGFLDEPTVLPTVGGESGRE